MLDVIEKILIVLLVITGACLLTCFGVIFYKASTGDDQFFVKKVYIVNQDFCKEEK